MISTQYKLYQYLLTINTTIRGEIFHQFLSILLTSIHINITRKPSSWLCIPSYAPPSSSSTKKKKKKTKKNHLHCSISTVQNYRYSSITIFSYSLNIVNVSITSSEYSRLILSKSSVVTNHCPTPDHNLAPITCTRLWDTLIVYMPLLLMLISPSEDHIVYLLEDNLCDKSPYITAYFLVQTYMLSHRHWR